MITNPFAQVPFKEAAWAEGFTKGLAAISSPEPSESISPEDADAFNEGVSAGADAASSGIPFPTPCMAALEGSHHETMVFTGIEVAHSVWELRHLTTLAAGFAGIVVALIELAVTLPVHLLPPEQVLPSTAQSLIDKLAGFGVDSMEFFVGVGLDTGSQDCEMLASPLFITQDQARQAAIDMARPEWIVVSWRTDQSNSFRFVEGSS
jgi:hypothetical protein